MAFEIRGSRKTVIAQLFVVNCKLLYNCIIGKPPLATSGAMSSMMNLKLKYHDEAHGSHNQSRDSQVLLENGL